MRIRGSYGDLVSESLPNIRIDLRMDDSKDVESSVQGSRPSEPWGCDVNHCSSLDFAGVPLKLRDRARLLSLSGIFPRGCDLSFTLGSFDRSISTLVESFEI